MDTTLSTTSAYKLYSNTPYTFSDASTEGVTQGAKNADSFLAKPLNVATLASAGGIIVGAAVGMGVATKCQKRVMHS